MKYFVSIFIALALLYPAFTQTVKPAKSSSAVKKPTPKKTASSRSNKPAAKKPAQTSTANSKKPTAAKKTTSKPKPAATPKKAPNEGEAYEAAITVEDASERISALRKFLLDFPQTEKRQPISEIIVRTLAGFAVEKLKANDLDGAAKLMIAAAGDAPKPIPENLYSETLIKFLPELFWRGQRAAAFETAKILEEKSSASVPQLLGIANFYMSVENGSEAKRVAGDALKIDPASAAAYQTLGLANRIEFSLEDSAAAYAKALELEPDSLTARRGLAEMKRGLGRTDEAAALYREILQKDEANVPAKTGLILALFDAGKRPEAEAELARALEAAPGNVMLLAGAAYWYAAQNEGQKAIDHAQKAIAADPRFIWSHIALARGYIADRRPMDAERTLLAARRYGNFPTLTYEIASARLMAGFYREAAEELTKSFTIKDGVLSTKLGGRVNSESKDFIELTARERQASIFTPTAAETKENAGQLRDLFDLATKLASKDADDDTISKAADKFAGGADPMQVYRLMYAGKELLDQKRALPKVVELARSAVGKDEDGMSVPTAGAAILADELYDSRRAAVARDEYIRSPDVSRQTLSAILRGRIEELNGWALYQTSEPAEAAVRLKRAVSVLPTDSPWWRSSMWRLGAALEMGGKDAEALEAYIKAYKASGPDIARYSVIQTAYKRVNGSIEGLDARVGPDPSPPVVAAIVPEKAEPSPTPEASPSAAASPSPEKTENEAPVTAATPTPTPESLPAEPKETPKTEATPETVPSPSPEKVEPTPEASPSTEPAKPEPTPETTPSPSPATVEPTPEASPSPEPAKPEPTPETTPSPSPATVEPTPEASPSPTPENTNVAAVSKPAKKPAEKPQGKSGTPGIRLGLSPKELFPPVVITIPAPEVAKKPAKTDVQKAATTDRAGEEKKPDEQKPASPDANEDPADPPKPCALTLSEESVTVTSEGGNLAVIVGLDDEETDISGIKAESSSPKDVAVRLEPTPGVKGRALFVIRSVSAKPGVYQVTFELPCGKKELVVKVR